MEPITRDDLRAFLYALGQTYILTGSIRPQFTKVVDALMNLAFDDNVKTLELAPPPALPDDDIPF